MDYTANDVLAEIARSFYGTDHEDWLRQDAGELRLGNLKVWVDGGTLIWRDLGRPRDEGSAEIPEGTGEDDELPDGSYVPDIVDEVSEWLLHWTDDIDDGELLACLQDEIGGGITEDVHGDPVLVADDGVTAWAVTNWDESPWAVLVRGTVPGELDIVWEDSYPIDPELVVTGHERKAVEEAYRGLVAEAGL